MLNVLQRQIELISMLARRVTRRIRRFRDFLLGENVERLAPVPLADINSVQRQPVRPQDRGREYQHDEQRRDQQLHLIFPSSREILSAWEFTCDSIVSRARLSLSSAEVFRSMAFTCLNNPLM